MKMGLGTDNRDYVTIVTDDFDNMKTIATTRLSKTFDSVIAVDGLDFEVGAGEIFGLVGPDGAGKTTTIRMLTTILAPTHGTALVAGHDIITQVDRVRAKIGYMAQQFNLYGDLTVAENLYFFSDLFNVKSAARDAKLVELYHFSGLEPFKDRRAKYLSGGMKQKLALACTLIHEPQVIFLDEPTTGVDPVSRRELWRILTELHGRGVTLFISTPYLDEAERCTTVAFIAEGRIQAMMSPQDLIEQYAGQNFELRCPENTEQICAILKDLPEVTEAECYPGVIKLTIQQEADITDVISQLRNTGVCIPEYQAVRASMESAFVSLARAAGDARA